MSFSILIVDDEEEICLSLSRLLEKRGYLCRFCIDSAEVKEELDEHPADLVLMDIRMPGISGINLLKILRKLHPNLPIAIISGHASINEAVEAMRYGVLDVFTKPLEMPRLIQEIERISETTSGKRQRSGATQIITTDKNMIRILKLADKAAPTNATVIIMGESGTGKELIANHIFEMSRKNIKPYIKINCAAIPESLIESELFGHERGAFTDARERHIGIFERAGEGTIFLDEIGDMSLTTQAKMLRILQEGRFTRVGGSKVIRTNCRVIAATNKNLSEEIAAKRFREDLFYRLAVINLQIPPLRERSCDITPLAEYFIGFFNSMYEKQITDMSETIRRFMTDYHWPGNIRELKNFVERAVIFADGSIINEDAISERYTTQMSRENQTAEDFTDYYKGARTIILEALNRSQGKKTEAAQLLNISRKTLYNRMRKFNIE
jgi:two-component system response regulator AtoC